MYVDIHLERGGGGPKEKLKRIGTETNLISTTVQDDDPNAKNAPLV